MKKFVVLLFILILALLCFGCYSAEQPPLTEVETELLAASQNLSGMEKGDGKALKV